MKPEDRYHRFVRWSEEDNGDIGDCPDSYDRGVGQADQEEAAFGEFCELVRAEIAHRLGKKENLPNPSIRATRDLDFAAA